MFFSLLAAIERKSGKFKVLVSEGSAAAGVPPAKVMQAYAKAMSSGKEGVEFREEFSNAILVRDNATIHNHDFPDLVAQEKSAEREKEFETARVKLAEMNNKIRAFKEHGEKLEGQLQAARNAFVAAGGNVDPSHPSQADADLEALRAQLAAAEKERDEAKAKLEALSKAPAEVPDAPPSAPDAPSPTQP